MKNYSHYSSRPSTNVKASRLFHSFVVFGWLFALLSACTASRSESAKGRPMRLTVGDINEVTVAARPDATYQLTATSDNQEVVDVSRKPTDVTAPGGTSSSTTGPTVFLIKGVTAGTARVVLSEKKIGTDGAGRTKKTYAVTVTNK